MSDYAMNGWKLRFPILFSLECHVLGRCVRKLNVAVSMPLLILVVALCLTPWSVGRAEGEGEGEGQADLDRATELTVSVETLADLERVTALCEDALEKGLDEGNAKFAKQLLTSNLYRHADRLSRLILGQAGQNSRWRALRKRAVADLEKLFEHDDEMGQAHFLHARLQALPGGDRNKARLSIGKAVKLLAKDKKEVAKALLLRANLAESPAARLGDLNQALEFDPKNIEALRTRGLQHLAAKNFEEAAADFTKALESGDDNVGVYHALAESLTNLKKYDEALERLDKALERRGSTSMTYNLRARIHVLKDDIPAALEDLGRALEKNPVDVAALLMRAQLWITQDDQKAALRDVERALEVEPGLVRGLELRASLLAAAGRYAESIEDIKKLVGANPKNTDLRIRLGDLLVAAERPRAAIDIYDIVIAEDSANWLALRRRADAQLSIGGHVKAIKDFEAALELKPEKTRDRASILNNLAWVLATSPKDDIRDGERAVTLAEQACDATDYKEAYILSTLAASHAEVGDWENALKWSAKAVELGDDTDVLEQLKEERASYEQKKPWRELQEVKEKPTPKGKRGARIEL